MNDTSGYIDADTTGTKGNAFGVQQIIFKQLDRIGFLESIGTVNSEDPEEFRKNAFALWRSALFLESLLHKFHSEAYKRDSPEPKRKSREVLNKVTGFETDFDEAWNVWFALLVSEMSMVGLLPIPEIDYHVQNNDGVWDNYKKRGIDHGHIYEEDMED